MAIGERIHHFRLLRGFTQKYLGQQLGFSESQADVRIAQYEKGARSPKENYLNALADIFDVSPHALAVPDIDSYVVLMHTLFTLEDLYGLHIGEIDGELCLRLDKSKGTTYLSMFDMFHAWQEQAEKFVEKYGKEAAWKVDTAFSGTRSNPSHRGMIAGIGVENFHPGALTVGVICGILNELHEQYEQMCQLTGKKATRLTGSGNGIRRNSLMRRLAEEMFKMPMEIPEYEEEAAYGAALTAGKLVAAM